MDINKQCLELWMCLQCNLKQGVHFWCDLHDKVLGKCHEFAYFLDILMKCLQV